MATSARGAVAWYLAQLRERPALTNAATGFVIAATGDVGCQLYLSDGEKRIDWRRTLDMALVRALVLSPFVSWYFPWLARLVPGSKPTNVLSRVLADQLIGSPVSICLTFAAVGVMRGEPEAIWPRIQSQLWPTWKTGATYWPFVHALNFRFVHVSHQPLVAHLASFWWNAVLSYRANATLQPPSSPAEVASTTPAADGITERPEALR